MYKLKPLFANNCQFSIKSIKENWSQFGIEEPKKARDPSLVLLEMNPE